MVLNGKFHIMYILLPFKNDKKNYPLWKEIINPICAIISIITKVRTYKDTDYMILISQ